MSQNHFWIWLTSISRKETTSTKFLTGTMLRSAIVAPKTFARLSIHTIKIYPRKRKAMYLCVTVVWKRNALWMENVVQNLSFINVMSLRPTFQKKFTLDLQVKSSKTDYRATTHHLDTKSTGIKPLYLIMFGPSKIKVLNQTSSGLLWSIQILIQIPQNHAPFVFRRNLKFSDTQTKRNFWINVQKF